MNLFEQMLSQAKPGTEIKLTLSSGQVIAGVVTQNDNTASLAVQITSTAVVRYDQIAAIEQFGITNAMPAMPLTQPQAQPLTETPAQVDMKMKDVKIPSFSCAQKLEEQYSILKRDQKKKLQSPYNKLINGIKNHDTDKTKQAVRNLWDTWDKDDQLYYDSHVTQLIAYVCYLDQDYQNAWSLFAYGDDLREAYLAAYEQETYAQAAAFAAAFLWKNKQTDVIPEAMEVLRIASLESGDMSGFAYVAKDRDASSYLCQGIDLLCYTMQKICQKKEIAVSGECTSETLLEALNNAYQGNAVAKLLEEFPQGEPEEPEESEEPEKSDSATNLLVQRAMEQENNMLSGKISKVTWVGEKGEITVADEKGVEKIYAFKFRDIVDKTLKSECEQGVSEQWVRFRLKDEQPVQIEKEEALILRRLDYANQCFMQNDFRGAFQLYQSSLDTARQENAFIGLLRSFLSIDETSDAAESYYDIMRELLRKYGMATWKKVIASKNTKKFSDVCQKFQKTYELLEMWEEYLELMQKELDVLSPDEKFQELYCHFGMAKSLIHLERKQEAMEHYEIWHKIYKKENAALKNTQLSYLNEHQVCPTLANLYFEAGDLAKARKYAEISNQNKVKGLLEKLDSVEKFQIPSSEENHSSDPEERPSSASVVRFEEELHATPIAPKLEPSQVAAEAEPEPEEESEPEKELSFYLEQYQDGGDFEKLGKTEQEVCQTALSFGAGKEYCMLSYLTAAASLCPALQPVSLAASYAYDDPAAKCHYTSEQVATIIYDVMDLDYLSKEDAEALVFASTLRALFYHYSIPDYGLGDIQNIALDGDLAKQHSAAQFLLNQLYSFRENTGYGMDAFADYVTNPSGKDGKTAEEIVRGAKECRDSIQAQCERSESVMRITITRKILFQDSDSKLKQCLEIVCGDDRSRSAEVQQVMTDLFIRKKHEISEENLDKKRIDDYVDDGWDRAADQMEENKEPVDRYVKLVGGRRGNIVNAMKRALVCICEWLDVVKKSTNSENEYANRLYLEGKNAIYSNLETLAEDFASVPGCGAASIVYTAKELCARLDGSYCPQNRKYFYQPFLLSSHILLGDDFLPELQGTFCRLPKFNVLSRIEQHAAAKLPTLEHRVDEIFGEERAQCNLRTARLIQEYAVEMGLDAVAKHSKYTLYSRCMNLAEKQILWLHQDFQNELELAQSYGRISDIRGVKTAIANCADVWYDITLHSGDFGFYISLLEALEQEITDNAKEYGEQLSRQLDTVFSNPELEHGPYTKEEIAGLIETQNYTAAENMINRIRRQDITEVRDFSEEPFYYLESFLKEYASLHEVVSDRGITMEKAIKRRSANTLMKDRRSGARLIEKWLSNGSEHAGVERVTQLLELLGWTDCTVTEEPNAGADIYNVRMKKRSGHIYYSHPIPAFGSDSEEDGFRVLCITGDFNPERLMDMLEKINTVSMNTIIFLDDSMSLSQRRHFARKLKENQSFSKVFLLIDRVLLFYLAKHYSTNAINRILMATALPFAYCQPFIPESGKKFPPELFTGRTAELEKIKSPNGANLIYGGRQLGKSALLNMARKEIDGNSQGHRAVVVDVFQLKYPQAARKVSQSLVDEGILDESCECDDWSVLTRHIKRRLMDEENPINYLLLMLDEGDIFIQSCGAIKYQPISELKEIQSSKFKFVIAGTHNLIRFNREEVLSNNIGLTHLEPLTIHPFKTPEGTELLTHALGYLGIRFQDENTISMILAQTNYFPGLIQLYCQKLLEAMKRDYAGYNETETPPYIVTETHLKSVLSDPGFNEMIRQKLDITLKVDKDEGGYYMIIALIIAELYYRKQSDAGYSLAEIREVAVENQIGRLLRLTDEQINELLIEMCDLNVLGDNGGTYVFSTKSFRELLGDQKEVANQLANYIGDGEEA